MKNKIIKLLGGYTKEEEKEWHIKDDVLNHINKEWDLIIAHPPCTYLSRAGCRWLFPKGE